MGITIRTATIAPALLTGTISLTLRANTETIAAVAPKVKALAAVIASSAVASMLRTVAETVRAAMVVYIASMETPTTSGAL
jgi:hypothetical protein